ncbi:helix-turn-helix domain-containing protein [Actinomadura gamaensis]|uniref:Helix-turn-helix domain-containing protein n=1 Tax=Actinomadura gamaensis TaxID=1763541 RepID=A0ABV9UBC1_9ACTN
MVRPHSDPDVRWFTVAEAAALMKVDKATVLRLIHSGELPAIRVGRAMRIPEQAIRDYLKNHHPTSHAAPVEQPQDPPTA